MLCLASACQLVTLEMSKRTQSAQYKSLVPALNAKVAPYKKKLRAVRKLDRVSILPLAQPTVVPSEARLHIHC